MAKIMNTYPSKAVGESLRSYFALQPKPSEQKRGVLNYLVKFFHYGSKF